MTRVRKIKHNQLQSYALNADPIAWWLGRQTVPLTSSGNLNNDLLLSASVYSSVKQGQYTYLPHKVAGMSNEHSIRNICVFFVVVIVVPVLTQSS